MPNTIWKEYEANPLTHSAAHYLMTINNLLHERGYARVTDIARELNITRGSCSISLKPLKKRGLVVEDDNKFLQLSEEGKRLAEVIAQNDKVLEVFFTEVLGVDREQAEIDACKIEHLLSIESSLKLAGFVNFFEAETRVCSEFRTAFKKSDTSCPKDVNECSLCSSTCLAEGADQ